MDSALSPDDFKPVSSKKSLVYHLIILFSALLLSYGLSVIIIHHAPFWEEKVLWLVPKSGDSFRLTSLSMEKLVVTESAIMKNNAGMKKKLAGFLPRKPYLIVNTANNTFMLMKNDHLIREGVCSTGSYIILTSGDKQKWVFETPRGMQQVKGKQQAPVWVKPDWAFIEEGLPVPPVRHSSRYEYGTLGDYKLTLGDGYMIHGTIYKRFLGMAVTHGCIRLGDDDLEAVYKNLQVGSKVFIY